MNCAHTFLQLFEFCRRGPIFVRNNCNTCDSTSNTNNVEIIQAQLNKLTVTSVYKPPNEQFSFGSNLASTQMNVVIGDFNSHGVEWGYRSTDENGRLVEQWSETNQLSLIHDAKHSTARDGNMVTTQT